MLRWDDVFVGVLVGSCWVGFGVVCWIGASLKTTIHYFFIQREHILYPLTISEKTYVPNLHYPSSILCRKGTQCDAW